MSTLSLKKIIDQLSKPLSPIPTGLQPAQQSIQPIKAVLFDIYGTLLISASGDIGFNTIDKKETLFNEALKASGLRPTFSCGVRGLTLFHQAIQTAHTERKKQGAHSPEVDIHSIWKAVLEQLHNEKQIEVLPVEEQIQSIAIHYECRVNPVWPMPGAKSVINELKQCGYHLGIVSNAQFYTPLTLETLLQESLETMGFDEQLCFWSYEHLESKPSPILFQMAAKALEKKYNISTQETLYIGNDKRNDVFAPKQIGFRAALFAGDKRSLRLHEDKPEIKAIKPDWIITELSQIVNGLLV